MKVYPVDVASLPAAAEPLTTLYLASRAGPVNGQHKRPRAKLAGLVSGALADLLRSGRPIRVRPKSAATWEVVEANADAGPESVLIEFVRAERLAQSLTLSEFARRSGLDRSYLSRLLSGNRASASFDQTCAMLRGLGKSLAWFEEHYLKPERSNANHFVGGG